MHVWQIILVILPGLAIIAIGILEVVNSRGHSIGFTLSDRLPGRLGGKSFEATPPGNFVWGLVLCAVGALPVIMALVQLAT
jgi:hypothetical protein